MARGSTALDNYDYDNWLANNKKEQVLRQRHLDRKSKGYTGWHFGIDKQPVKTNSKEEFHKALEQRGLLDASCMRRVVINGKTEWVHKR